jgi:hypothetical protein
MAQRESMRLPNAEAVINKKCDSTAEILLAWGTPTGKVAHIYLLMDGKYFTLLYLKKFFACISRGYPKLAALKITALSDKKELEIKIERFLHPPAISETIGRTVNNSQPAPLPNYYRAYYQRSNVVNSRKYWDGFRSSEYFEYSPNPRKWRMVIYNFRKPSVPLVKIPS